MSRAKNIKATPRADRLRDFVAARALDERMNLERQSFVSDLLGNSRGRAARAASQRKFA